ncbi:hypothetical protein GCM10009113_16270 [Marinobacter szutsaonensis]
MSIGHFRGLLKSLREPAGQGFPKLSAAMDGCSQALQGRIHGRVLENPVPADRPAGKWAAI